MKRCKRLVLVSVIGLLLGFLGLTGCDSESSQATPGTGGAGIPGNRGPVSSKMPKPGAAVKAKPAAPHAGPESTKVP
jgi:hypothetical protein